MFIFGCDVRARFIQTFRIHRTTTNTIYRKVCRTLWTKEANINNNIPHTQSKHQFLLCRENSNIFARIFTSRSIKIDLLTTSFLAVGWVCSLMVDGKISAVLTWNRLTPKMVMLVLVTLSFKELNFIFNRFIGGVGHACSRYHENTTRSSALKFLKLNSRICIYSSSCLMMMVQFFSLIYFISLPYAMFGKLTIFFFHSLLTKRVLL